MPNPIINRRIVLSRGGYSPEALAYFAALSVQPSTVQKIRLDNYLFKPLVAAGIFTELDRLWIFASEIQANGLVSLVNPTATAAAEVNAPGWVQYQGYTGNGTTSYLNLNYIPSSAGVDFTQNSASLGLYSRSNQDSASIDIGCSDGTRASSITPSDASSLINYTANDATQTTHSITDSLGLISWRRTASNAKEAFRNGVSLGTATTASIGLPTVTMFALARNVSGTPFSFSTRQLSCAFTGSGTFSHLTLYNIIQNYMTAIGSAV